jgi:thiamine biosynthesis lipoprotein
VVEDLIAAGADGALVAIGGDLRAMGEGPDGGWTIAVEDPLARTGELTRLALQAGGVATSSTRWRRWVIDGEERHHVLDPSTGRPTSGAIVAATVVAGTAAWAEAWTKAVMVRGPEHVLAELDALGLGALAVRADGATMTNETWKDFT